MLAKKKVKVRIKVNELVNDLRAGMSDIELMGRYGLSAKGLESTFRKLVEGNFISQTELNGRAMPYSDTADIQNLRRVKRSYPALTVSVRDFRIPGEEGLLHDVSERGIGVRGLAAKPNETRIFVLEANEVEEMSPFMFEGLCRWARLDEETSICTAGFEISRISDENLGRLRRLIREVTFSD